MSQEEFKIADLIFSYIKGELTEAQSAELARWIESGENNKELFERLVLSASFRDKREIYSRFEQYSDYGHLQAAVHRMRKLRVRRISIAAAVAVVVVAGATLLLNERFDAGGSMAAHSGIFGDGNRAVLTIGTGESLPMDAIDGEFLEEDGSVIRLGAGGISYDAIPEEGDDVWHSISISRGGEYMVRLIDGTRIWLNSASSLHYPLKFPDGERRVELNGEAYFEVAHDSARPFIVESGGQRVVVLGTEFNVSAYGNETQVLTTLIEGSVRVEAAGGSSVLVPGNQSRMDKGSGRLDIRTVDTDEVVAWKEGLFVIEEQTLTQILRQLTRWYDVEFTVDAGIAEDMTFKGSIPKYQDLESTLKRLEMISNLKMKINGRTVKVYN